MIEGEGEIPTPTPTACESTSTESCGCLSWPAFTEMAAKARMVDQGTCVVLQQGGYPTGVEGGLGMALGFLLACLWAALR